VPALVWRTLPGATGPKALVKGTALARAVVPGTRHRFVAYEVRAIGAQGEPDVRFIVRDAEAITDADVRAGKSPPITDVDDDCEALVRRCVALCGESP
jgi:hypothetical protein